MLLTMLHFMPDADEPVRSRTRCWRRCLPQLPGPVPRVQRYREPGLSRGRTERYNAAIQPVPITRTRAQVTQFFDGLDIVEPGVVPLGHWHPGPLQQFDAPGLPTYCAVGRKP